MNTKTYTAGLMQVALMAASAVLATWAAANPIDVKSVDGNEPVNSPSYDSTVHRQAASELCAAETGRNGLVRAGKVVAGHVVVVRLDGVMERMDTTEAWGRAESKTRADDIWVVGVCKADVAGLKDVKA